MLQHTCFTQPYTEFRMCHFDAKPQDKDKGNIDKQRGNVKGHVGVLKSGARREGPPKSIGVNYNKVGDVEVIKIFCEARYYEGAMMQSISAYCVVSMVFEVLN